MKLRITRSFAVVITAAAIAYMAVSLKAPGVASAQASSTSTATQQPMGGGSSGGGGCCG